MKAKHSDEELAYNCKERSDPVIFRKYAGGDIIALFPNIPATGYYVTDYMHIGQHGEADYDYVISHTKPAAPAEYKDLKEELEEIGYDLRVMQRRVAR